MMDEVNRQLDTVRASPGADEAALFNKLVSIILEEKHHFDQKSLSILHRLVKLFDYLHYLS